MLFVWEKRQIVQVKKYVRPLGCVYTNMDLTENFSGYLNKNFWYLIEYLILPVKILRWKHTEQVSV